MESCCGYLLSLMFKSCFHNRRIRWCYCCGWRVDHLQQQRELIYISLTLRAPTNEAPGVLLRFPIAAFLSTASSRFAFRALFPCFGTNIVILPVLATIWRHWFWWLRRHSLVMVPRGFVSFSVQQSPLVGVFLRPPASWNSWTPRSPPSVTGRYFPMRSLARYRCNSFFHVAVFIFHLRRTVSGWKGQSNNHIISGVRKKKTMFYIFHLYGLETPGVMSPDVPWCPLMQLVAELETK